MSTAASTTAVQRRRRRRRVSLRNVTPLLVLPVVILWWVPSLQSLSVDKPHHQQPHKLQQQQQQRQHRRGLAMNPIPSLLTSSEQQPNLNYAPVRPYRPPAASYSSLSTLFHSASGATALSSTNTDQDVTSSPSEYELGVGKALDTLRNDYPTLLVSPPDYSIYRKDISVIDPSGVHVHGLIAYKNAFRLLHGVIKLIYCAERSSLNFKLCYDQARHNIRIHWHAHVVPREIFGGVRTTLHVDGISVYELDSTGNISEHRIEQLLINDIPVQPPEGIIAALQDRHSGITAIPTFCEGFSGGSCTTTTGGPISNNNPWPSTMLEFRPHHAFPNLAGFMSSSKKAPVTSLFAFEGMGDQSATSASSPKPSSSGSSAGAAAAAAAVPNKKQSQVVSTSSASAQAKVSKAAAKSAAAAVSAANVVASSSLAATGEPQQQVSTHNEMITAETMDYVKFEQKNKSRKKFGLQPLTIEEFVELEQQVAQLAAQQRQKMEASKAASAAAAAEQQEEKNRQQQSSPNIFEKLFGAVLRDTCESNFDCERPEICCDFGFKKMCCAAGTPVGRALPEYAFVPVPVDVQDYPRDNMPPPPRY